MAQQPHEEHRSDASRFQSRPPYDIVYGMDGRPDRRWTSLEEAEAAMKSPRKPICQPQDWEEEVDETRIRALALQIRTAECIPMWMATERAAIELYGSDVRAVPVPEDGGNNPASPDPA